MNLAIFVGPAKTGTTWLFEYAKLHPELLTSTKDKEIQFFNKYFTRGIDWYQSYFDQESNLLKCDFSPSYFASELGRFRLKKNFPEAKIIITLRNPIKRTISHYKHFLKLGLINETNPRIALGKNTTFMANSFYTKYLSDWIEDFGVENVLILPIEEMQENPEDYLRRLCSFLKIGFFETPELTNKKINEQSIPRSRILAFLASRVRRFTKDHQVPWLTNLAKGLGMKKFIYSGGKSDISISKEVIEELDQVYESEIQKLEEYISPTIYKKYYRK